MYKFFVIPNITPGAYFRWGRGRGAYTRKKFSVSKFIHKRSGACFRVVVVVGGGGGGLFSAFYGICVLSPYYSYIDNIGSRRLSIM